MQSGRYLPTLDGWRAVAITMVVLSHALTTESASTGGSLSRFTFRLGTFGVMLFFAISGFLICTRLLIEEENTGAASLRSFYVRRIFRILPAAYAYLGVVAALGFAGVIAAHWADILKAGAVAANYFPPDSWFTGHFWSLAIEEHFYLLWPPLLVVLGRKRAVWAGAALIVLTVILRVHVSAGGDLPGYTQLRLDAFMFPCILAILLRERRISGRFSKIMTPLTWWSLLIVLAAGIALAGAVPLWREPQRVLQSATLPLIIAATVLRPNDWVGRLLRLPALEWLGRISYSVYLWQQLVFGFGPWHWPARLIALPFLIAAILVLAALSYRWIEQPMIALGKRLDPARISHSPLTAGVTSVESGRGLK